MQDRKFKKSVFMAVVMIIIESLLLLGKSYSQPVPAADTNKGQAVISKVVGSAELQAALRRCKSNSLIISFYPVRAVTGKRDNSWDFKVVYQCKEDKVTSAQAGKSTKVFTEGVRAYVKHLRKMQVPKENIPFCYYIEITPEEAKNLLGIAVSLDPYKSDFKASNIFSCGTYAGGDNNTENCDCKTQPVYLAYSTIPPGKCPPNCPRMLKQSTFTKTVEKMVEAIYYKQ